MAVAKESVSAIKGNSITGSLWIYNGIYEGTVTVDTDFSTSGFVEMGLASSDEGISYAQSADSSAITAWGDNKIADIFSNSAATVTINLFSFLEVETLRTVFGRDAVTVSGSTVTVNLLGAGGNQKQNSIAVVGLDRSGNAAILYAPRAAVDPNIEFTWNDADPVAIPALFNLYKEAGSFGKILIERPTTGGSGE